MVGNMWMTEYMTCLNTSNIRANNWVARCFRASSLELCFVTLCGRWQLFFRRLFLLCGIFNENTLNIRQPWSGRVPLQTLVFRKQIIFKWFFPSWAAWIFFAFYVGKGSNEFLANPRDGDIGSSLSNSFKNLNLAKSVWKKRTRPK